MTAQWPLPWDRVGNGRNGHILWDGKDGKWPKNGLRMPFPEAARMVSRSLPGKPGKWPKPGYSGRLEMGYFLGLSRDSRNPEIRGILWGGQAGKWRILDILETAYSIPGWLPEG